MARRVPTTLGQLCEDILEVIAWLEKQPPGRTFTVVFANGDQMRSTAGELLQTDEIRDIRTAGRCNITDETPITGGEAEGYRRITGVLLQAKDDDERKRMYLIGGGVLAAIGLAWYVSRTASPIAARRSMSALELPQVAPGKCCPARARVTKNNRCHDGQKFVPFVSCVTTRRTRRVGVPEPFPKARW